MRPSSRERRYSTGGQLFQNDNIRPFFSEGLRVQDDGPRSPSVSPYRITEEDSELAEGEARTFMTMARSSLDQESLVDTRNVFTRGNLENIENVAIYSDIDEEVSGNSVVLGNHETHINLRGRNSLRMNSRTSHSSENSLCNPPTNEHANVSNCGSNNREGAISQFYQSINAENRDDISNVSVNGHISSIYSRSNSGDNPSINPSTLEADADVNGPPDGAQAIDHINDSNNNSHNPTNINTSETANVPQTENVTSTTNNNNSYSSIVLGRQHLSSRSNPFANLSTTITGSVPSGIIAGGLAGSLAGLGVLDTSDLNNHVLFYLCGRCVSFDSFDADSVKLHLDLECPGMRGKWATTSELYLALRAAFFVVLVLTAFAYFIYYSI